MLTLAGRAAAVLFVVLASATAGAQRVSFPAETRDAAERISAEQLAWDLAWLAADERRGRNTPSPQFDAAADYITTRLKAAGLAPAGDAGSFRQHYELHETRVDTTAAAIVVGERRFTFGGDFAVATFSQAISGALPVVYVGHGWVIPGQGIDPYAAVDVRGKLVLAHGPRTLPKGVDISQVGRTVVGAQSPVAAAAARGAAGVLFITQASELVRWDELKTRGTVAREMSPAVPSAYAAVTTTSLLLAPHVTTALLEGEKLAGRDAIRLAERGEFPASFALAKTVSVQIPVGARSVYRPYNVVATLEGSDPQLKAETVTIAAHLDGAVGTRPLADDGIYNAADDNASGSAALLAIAEQMAGLSSRPKRTIVFLWDSGEEQGLWGTRRFIHDPPVAKDRIVAHINVDMIGASRRPGSPDEQTKTVTERNEVFVIGPRTLSAQAETLLSEVNKAYLGLRFNHEHDRGESEFFYPRTDAGPFLERGILTVGFTTGIHGRYHLPSDEAGTLDPAQVHAIARTVFASLWALADATERPRIDKPVPPSVPKHP